METLNLGLFNSRGINSTEHFIPLELEELRKRGHNVELYWVKGKHPTKEELKQMDFAIFHFVPTALYFCNIGVPFCILPTANDIFPNNGILLRILETHDNCKFVGYQSFYHKRRYDEWELKKPLLYVPHCVRTELFKRQTVYNPLGRLVAGGRLIPKKGLDRLKNIKHLTIFGDGPLKESLQKELDDAIFVGHLYGNQLKELFEESSVYLFPAVITSNGDSEGISNTIKEALLMELQIICTPIAGNTEFENVSFLSDWDKESIENAISCLPNEANMKGRIEILKNFSPEICINKLEKAIKQYV